MKIATRSLFLLTLLLPLALSGQEPQTKSERVAQLSQELKQSGSNEIRLNILTSVAGLPEIDYEYFAADNMGVGFALAFSLESKDDMAFRYMAMPYYRLYFGQKKASGFFIEGNMALIGVYDDKDLIYVDPDSGTSVYFDPQFTDNFGMGFAIGGKFLARNGFIGEIYAGMGRVFGDSAAEAYPRIGICLGNRF